MQAEPAIHPDNPLLVPTLGLGVVAFGLALVQLGWYAKHRFVQSATSHMVLMIALSGLVALCNGLSTAFSYQTFMLYSGLSAAFRTVWVYQYLLLLLSIFDWKGGGGRNEVVDAAGAVLEEAKLPEQSYLCCVFMVCAGARKFTPGRAFIKASLTRVEAYVAGTLVVLVINQTLFTENAFSAAGHDKCPEATDAVIKNLLTVLNLCLTFLGLTGIILLNNVVSPLVLPDSQPIVTFRSRMYTYMQVVTAVQSGLIFGQVVPAITGNCDSRDVEAFTVAVEMLLIQICHHKAFIPGFEWKCWGNAGIGSKTIEEIESGMLERGFHLLVPVEEMAAKFTKGDDESGEGTTQVIEMNPLSSGV